MHLLLQSYIHFVICAFHVFVYLYVYLLVFVCLVAFGFHMCYFVKCIIISLVILQTCVNKAWHCCFIGLIVLLSFGFMFVLFIYFVCLCWLVLFLFACFSFERVYFVVYTYT